jgi:SAM-dependent methyltransferase
MEKEWFERWFGEEYKALYPHRSEIQADAQVRALVEASSAISPWKILDVGCGSGRHLRSFRARGFHDALGIDLSSVLLHDARATGLAVARADMRRLPFADGIFDLLSSFFTSFGYFATRDEDTLALREFCRVIRRSGHLFLDLHNSELLLRELIPHETRPMEGGEVEVERFQQGDQIVKRLCIRKPECGEKTFEERIRLYSLSTLQPILKNLDLTILRVFGDESGAEFSEATSPRMGLLLRRDA